MEEELRARMAALSQVRQPSLNNQSQDKKGDSSQKAFIAFTNRKIEILISSKSTFFPFFGASVNIFIILEKGILSKPFFDLLGGLLLSDSSVLCQVILNFNRQSPTIDFNFHKIINFFKVRTWFVALEKNKLHLSLLWDKMKLVNL